jgi:HEAT repeat protein
MSKTAAIIVLACSLVFTFIDSPQSVAANTSRQATQQIIDKSIKQLKAGDVQSRVTGLKQLGALGPAAKRALPAIIDLVNENRASTANFDLTKPVSPSITSAALEALKSMGPLAHEAAPYITPLLKDRNELFRRTQVLETLNAIGPSSDSASVIMRVVSEEGKFTAPRVLAISLLGRIDPPAVDATDLLRTITEDETDKKARAEANKALDSILRRAADSQAKGKPTEDQVLRKLRLELDAKNTSEERIAALDRIAELGVKAAPLVPTLMQTISDKDDAVRHAALDTLGSMRSAALTAVPTVVSKFMLEKDQGERGYFARAICKIDPTGARTIPLLQEPLEDPFKVRLAIEILQELGTDESTTIAQKARQRWRIRQ